MHRIKKFNVYQTSKVVGITYFFISAVIAIPMGIIASLGGMKIGGFESIFMFIAPIIYGFLGFFGTAIVCWIYNLVARSTGGVEFDLERLGIDTKEKQVE